MKTNNFSEGKMSRRPHSPTRETRRLVEAMSAAGIPQEQIAIVIEVDAKTLRKYYRDELDKASIKANARVASSLYENAVSQKNVAAQIFWLKTRCGWKETTTIENIGPNGGPMQVDMDPIDYSELTDDEILELQRLRNLAKERAQMRKKIEDTSSTDE